MVKVELTYHFSVTVEVAPGELTDVIDSAIHIAKNHGAPFRFPKEAYVEVDGIGESYDLVNNGDYWWFA